MPTLGPRTGTALAGVVLIVLPAGLLIAGVSGPGPVGSDTPVGAGRAAPAEGTPELVAGARPLAPATPDAVVPRALRIPSLRIDASLVPLSTDRVGRLLPPADPDRPGWYVDSAVPGEVGPAVLAGHLDSRTGPAVFYRLPALKAGAVVEVVLSDGRMVRFRVVSVNTYAKAAFPTARVYGPTPERALRLITCGGEYERRAGGYQDNVVVYAVAA